KAIDGRRSQRKIVRDSVISKHAAGKRKLVADVVIHIDTCTDSPAFRVNDDPFLPPVVETGVSTGFVGAANETEGMIIDASYPEYLVLPVGTQYSRLQRIQTTRRIRGQLSVCFGHSVAS